MSIKEDLAEIKSKLAKLKALHEGAATEGEALAAAAAISRCLLKYNLTSEDIPDIDDIDHQPYESFTIDLETTSMTVYDFRYELLRVIAKAHFCEVIKILGQKREWTKQGRPVKVKYVDGTCNVIGKKDNVDTTIALYHYLKEEIRHLTRNA